MATYHSQPGANIRLRNDQSLETPSNARCFCGAVQLVAGYFFTFALRERYT